jgi:hypothetical protein
MKSLVLTLAIIVLTAPSGRSVERLSMKLAPAVGSAPAVVTIRTRIEPNAENRTLTIVMQSGDYFRSSEVSLDGSNAPRVNEWVFRGIPAGRYAVTASLSGASQPLASAVLWFEATSSPGR